MARWLLKPAVFAAALVPATYLSLQVAKTLGYLAWSFVGDLSANPLSDVTNRTGDWTIRFICIALAVTPFRRISGWNGAIRLRRILGLFAFFYGTLHFLTYLVLDRLAGPDFPNGIAPWATLPALPASAGAALYKRPPIPVGFTA